LEELRRRDLPPFAAAIKAGTIAIMPSHLRLPELTGDLPATVSGAALTGLLRGELGFTGVVVCDALEMRATRDAFGIPGAAVLAVAAGTHLPCPGRGGGGGQDLAVRGRPAGISGARLVLRRPLVIEVEPRENIAAGRFTWGLSPWVPAGSVRRVSAGADSGGGGHAAGGPSWGGGARRAGPRGPPRPPGPPSALPGPGRGPPPSCSGWSSGPWAGAASTT